MASDDETPGNVSALDDNFGHSEEANLDDSESISASNSNNIMNSPSAHKKLKRSKHPSTKHGNNRLMSSRKGVPAKTSVQFHLQSVVKIYVKKVIPSQSGPWKMSSEHASTGTGFIIPPNRLLTNAHVVHRAQSILCRPQSGSRKFELSPSLSLSISLFSLSRTKLSFWTKDLCI